MAFATVGCESQKGEGQAGPRCEEGCQTQEARREEGRQGPEGKNIVEFTSFHSFFSASHCGNQVLGSHRESQEGGWRHQRREVDGIEQGEKYFSNAVDLSTE